LNDPHQIKFAFVDGIAVIRIAGRYTLHNVIHRIGGAIAQASSQRIRKLVVVVIDATGFEVPSLAMLASMIREWTHAGAGIVSVAMVCRHEFIDPERFGIAFAANLGVVANVFESEGEALQWLREFD
jgi:hypothetical protein